MTCAGTSGAQAAGPATAARSATKCDPRKGRWPRRRREVDEVERMAAGRHVNYAAAEARTGASDCAALRATTRSRRTEEPLHGESGRGKGAAG